jgi:two-component system LytT family response regulator
MYDRLTLLKTNLETDKVRKIAVPVSDGFVLVKINEISHADADGSYTRLHLIDGTNMLVSKKLIYFEELLANQEDFKRVHRSHLINLSLVKKYSRHESEITMENNHKIKVARDKKSEFEESIKTFTVRNQ